MSAGRVVGVGPVRSRGWLILGLLTLIAIAVGGFVYSKWPRAPAPDPIGTMVLAFSKQNALTVFSAQVVTVVTNSEERMFGLLSSSQTAVIPATVEYRLEQSGLTRDKFTWNAEAQSMSVVVPSVIVGTPNLDEGRARYFRNGLPLTGNAQARLSRSNTVTASREAVREANNPQLLALARTAARDAVAQNVAAPLRAAGYERVTVAVRFADEPDGKDPSYLDQSRRVEDVLKERARTTPGVTPAT